LSSLPTPFGGDEVCGWRLDREEYASVWDTGEGAMNFGGRWNSRGRRAVYSCLDPATAILEVAVHKGFRALDTIKHVMTRFAVEEAHSIHVVNPPDVPNPNWLRPGPPSAGQQEFGDSFLGRYLFTAIPSAVSSGSWNLIFDPLRARGRYRMISQEHFALDTRLYPVTGPGE
jgi:RES domain-containing protein